MTKEQTLVQNTIANQELIVCQKLTLSIHMRKSCINIVQSGIKVKKKKNQVHPRSPCDYNVL